MLLTKLKKTLANLCDCSDVDHLQKKTENNWEFKDETLYMSPVTQVFSDAAVTRFLLWCWTWMRRMQFHRIIQTFRHTSVLLLLAKSNELHSYWFTRNIALRTFMPGFLLNTKPQHVCTATAKNLVGPFSTDATREAAECKTPEESFISFMAVDIFNVVASTNRITDILSLRYEKQTANLTHIPVVEIRAFLGVLI